MSTAAAIDRPSRLVTERQLAPKQWVWHDHDDKPDPPGATGPPRPDTNRGDEDQLNSGGLR